MLFLLVILRLSEKLNLQYKFVISSYGFYGCGWYIFVFNFFINLNANMTFLNGI